MDPLVARLRDGDRNVRIQAALDIGKLDDERAAAPLIEALAAEPDFFVRETITWSVVRLGPAAVPLLIECLRDETARVRHDAAHALSKIADPHATDALITALGDENAGVIAKAAFALGQIGDARAIPGVVALLGTENRELESALNAVLERFGSVAVPALVIALGDASERKREQAADALRVIGDAVAAPALTALLRDASWRARFAALNALSRLDATPALFEAAREDADPRVRALAERVLSERT